MPEKVRTQKDMIAIISNSFPWICVNIERKCIRTDTFTISECQLVNHSITVENNELKISEREILMY